MSSEDVRIHDPASREKEKQPYGEGDVKNIMEGHQWRNWDELISFVREEGDRVRGVTPGEAKQMLEDFQRMKQRGAKLPSDPHELYQMAHSG
jgi:hypothetical protein